jgi:hypothetical protein
MVVLSLRSLWTHKVKTLTVGSLLFFGTFLVVVGTALLDSIESSMARSITASLAGHVQLYDKPTPRTRSRSSAAGSWAPTTSARSADFSAVKAVVEAVPNVKAIVPMGIGMATISTPVELDQVFASPCARPSARRTRRPARRAGGQAHARHRRRPHPRVRQPREDHDRHREAWPRPRPTWRA